MPSIEVPLIRPTARSSWLMVLPGACARTCSGAGSSCMFRRPRGHPTRVRPFAQTTGCRPWPPTTSDFLNVLNERGFIHQCSDFAGSRRARREGRGGGLRRLRLHRPVAAHRHLIHHDDAALAAADRRRQADRADGRRHHPGGRPLGPGRDAQDPARRADRGQQGRHPARVRQVPEVRRRARPTRSWSTTPSG